MSVDYQNIANLSFSESFLKIPSLAVSSSTVVSDLSGNPETFNLQWRNLTDPYCMPCRTTSFRLEDHSSQDLPRIALTLFNYVSTLKENSKMDVLDNVFSNKAVAFDAEETQAKASVAIS
jgi:hypothetical protein